jgi:glutathione synthase/RimK-type ligase-like ATP-grasp enzyme
MTSGILLWGLLEDPTMASVHELLRATGADVLFLNHAAVDTTHVRFSTEPEITHILRYDGRSWPLEKFDAAYLRPYDARDYGDCDAAHAIRVHHLISDWAQYSDATIVNRPSAEATNHSKLGQAAMIAAAGFDVPDSIVTNDAEQIRAFHARHGDVVCKSLSAVRSVVKELSVEDLPAGPIGPAFVQQRIVGTNVRVHVVGASAFACRIESDGVDYRYARSRIELATIPDAVASRCVGLADQLGLLLAGIDLIVTPENKWYCLEVNPNPGFSVYDHDGSVARAVAELLTAGAPESR